MTFIASFLTNNPVVGAAKTPGVAIYQAPCDVSACQSAQIALNCLYPEGPVKMAVDLD